MRSRRFSCNRREVIETPRRFLLALGITALWVVGGGLPAVLTGFQDPASKTAAKPSTGASRETSAQPSRPPPSSNDPNKIRVRVREVSVAVTVLDKRGLPVIDLAKGDFQIYEDGKRQNILFFGREPQPPLWIGLILDTSNSARRLLSFEKEAASEFVFTMLKGRGSKNQIFLQTFDATSSIIQDFTNEPDALNEKILGLKAGGGKALYDAIYFACKEKLLKAGRPEATRRVLVIVSDGRDVSSEHTLEEAISMAHRAESMIYTIENSGYGYSNPGGKVLEKLAAETGGAAFAPLERSPGTDLETGYLSHGQIGETSQNKGLGADTGAFSAQRLIQIADSLEAIGRELDEQYNIGYRPSNGVLDGTYRAIRVVASRKGAQVRSKPGYFATPE